MEHGSFEDVFPLEISDITASYVCLQEKSVSTMLFQKFASYYLWGDPNSLLTGITLQARSTYIILTMIGW